MNAQLNQQSEMEKQQFVYMSGTQLTEQVREAYQPVWLVLMFIVLITGMSLWGLAMNGS